MPTVSATVELPEVINGPYIEHFPNGNLLIEGTMRDAKRVGVWRSYHLDGRIASESNYVYGAKEGKTASWYENGQIRYIGYYHNDEASAKWLFYLENGELEKEVDYSQN